MNIQTTKDIETLMKMRDTAKSHIDRLSSLIKDTPDSRDNPGRQKEIAEISESLSGVELRLMELDAK